MGLFRHSLVLVGLLSCRGRFDEVHDAGTSIPPDGPLPPTAPWVAWFGAGATAPTVVRDVHEDAFGDVWLVGDSQAFGANYSSGWLARVDGVTGALELSGVRSFYAGETYVMGAALLSDRIIIAGSGYDPTLSQSLTIGTLRFDGSWLTSFHVGGGLEHPGEYEEIGGFTLAPNNRLVAVGSSRIGTGSCTGCEGTDAVVIHYDLAGNVESAFTLGSVLGDEQFEHVAVLPDGELLVAGRSPRRDYSGAGTDIDSGYSLLARLTASGTVLWAQASQARGSAIDVMRISGTDALVGGGLQYTFDPVFARMPLDGRPPEWREVDVNGLSGYGRVTGIAEADNGDLFVAGFEAPNDSAARIGFVLRTSASGDTLVWARTFPIGYSIGPDIGLRRSRRGDLLIWGSGFMMGAFVTRIGEDGTLADCFATTPANVTLTMRVDTPTTPTLALTPITDAAMVARTPVTAALPAGADGACSP